jgi:alcohol oxidase
VFESEFLLAAEQQGYPKIPDLQGIYLQKGNKFIAEAIIDLTSNNGFSRWRKTISRDGRRQDTAHQYLHPLLQDGEHPNLHVLVQTKITRVLFDENKRASAVECVPNETFTGGLSLNQSTTKCIQARKMIIICSGSLGTPTILERSGIGNPYILEKFDIPVVSSLPGVGEDYQDHQLVQVAYNLQLKAEVKDKSVPSEDVNLTGELENKDIRPGWSGVDLSSKLRPTTAEVEQLGPEFEAMWNKEFKNAPERPLVVMGIAARYVRSMLYQVVIRLTLTPGLWAIRLPFLRVSMPLWPCTPHIHSLAAVSILLAPPCPTSPTLTPVSCRMHMI